MLKSNQAKDFYFGIQPNRGVAGKNKLEEHHIFPKKSVLGKNIVKQFENHKYEDVINNIANIALITKETNNNKIGSKLPSEYMKDMYYSSQPCEKMHPEALEQTFKMIDAENTMLYLMLLILF